MNEFNFDHKPLLGKIVLITRMQEQISLLSDKLQRLGAKCIEVPVIEIKPPDSFAELDQAVQDIHTYQWLLFNNVNGVDCFFKRLAKADMNLCSMPLQVAAIGTAVAERLKEYSSHADLVPLTCKDEGTVEALSRYIEKGMRVLFPKDMMACDQLPKRLREIGVKVTVAPAYKAVADEKNNRTIAAKLLSGGIDAVIFASEFEVAPLLALLGEHAAALVTKTKIACIGPITASACLDNGIRPDVIAEKYKIQGLAEAVVRLLGKESV
jgi:uroporphyrinogen III methyltransferase/synthase